MSLAMESTTDIDYAPVRAKDHVARGTGFHLTVGFFAAIVVMLFTILVTYGIALLAWIFAALFSVVIRRRAHARLHGSALKVGPQQFPEIYETCLRMSDRLGLKECPDIYIIEDNAHNAFAMKHGRKKYVILIDDIVFGAERTGNDQALDFIIGHELAHHALGHTGMFRRLISSSYRPLSRLDEFSCDAVAHKLVNSTRAAQDALALLLIGPQLYSRVNKEALDEQAREVTSNRASKASEGGQTHPLLLRRYARLIEG